MYHILYCRKSPLKLSNAAKSLVDNDNSPVKITPRSVKRRIESDDEDDAPACSVSSQVEQYLIIDLNMFFMTHILSTTLLITDQRFSLK